MAILGDCITNSTKGPPDIFTDTTGLTINFDNLGVATVSFAVIHKTDIITGGPAEFTINLRRFTGTINSVIQTDIEGTDYKESRVSFIGFAC